MSTAYCPETAAAMAVAQNAIPAGPPPTRAIIRSPTAFLCLAPVHSETFPKAPVSPRLAPTAGSSIAAIMEVPLSPLEKPTPTHRRSSTSSIGSVNEKRRFLKLGPVHWGGAVGENDYAIED
ncbi:hypothetical protein RUND412_007622 [Rhizina undulata]